MRPLSIIAITLLLGACGDDKTTPTDVTDTTDTDTSVIADTLDTVDTIDTAEPDTEPDVEADGTPGDTSQPPASTGCLPTPTALKTPSLGLPCELIPPGLDL